MKKFNDPRYLFLWHFLFTFFFFLADGELEMVLTNSLAWFTSGFVYLQSIASNFSALRRTLWSLMEVVSFPHNQSTIISIRFWQWPFLITHLHLLIDSLQLLVLQLLFFFLEMSLSLSQFLNALVGVCLALVSISTIQPSNSFTSLPKSVILCFSSWHFGLPNTLHQNLLLNSMELILEPIKTRK